MLTFCGSPLELSILGLTVKRCPTPGSTSPCILFADFQLISKRQFSTLHSSIAERSQESSMHRTKEHNFN
jgi:hypothetical protein